MIAFREEACRLQSLCLAPEFLAGARADLPCVAAARGFHVVSG